MSDVSYCKKIQRRHGGKYYIATMFFPSRIRIATYALYGWVRTLDDIVDETETKEEATVLFDAWISAWHRAEAGHDPKRPEMRLFTRVVREFGIPKDDCESFISSMRMDLERKEYADIHELEKYMYGSATVVGLMMMRIMGDYKEDAVPYATALAEAMQLANFLRDVKDDWFLRGRIYLPRQELQRFGLDLDDVKNCKLSAPFMQHMVAMTRARFKHAEAGIHLLPVKARFPVLLSSRLYEAILDDIERHKFDVYSRRARTSIWRKIIITVKTYIWYRKNMRS